MSLDYILSKALAKTNHAVPSWALKVGFSENHSGIDHIGARLLAGDSHKPLLPETELNQFLFNKEKEETEDFKALQILLYSSHKHTSRCWLLRSEVLKSN